MNHLFDVNPVMPYFVGISKDMREVIMSPDQDSFFKDSLYSDFGEIGIKIKELVDKFQQQQHSTADISSIADMKKFVDNYPQFKKFSGAFPIRTS